jgi:hypothetical protein
MDAQRPERGGDSRSGRGASQRAAEHPFHFARGRDVIHVSHTIDAASLIRQRRCRHGRWPEG